MNQWVGLIPFPQDMLALVNAMPPGWVTLVTTMVLPLILLIASVCLLSGLQNSRYVMAAIYFWGMVVQAWAFANHLPKRFDAPLSVTVSDSFVWIFLVGIVTYAILGVLSLKLGGDGPQDNKSFNTETGSAGSG